MKTIFFSLSLCLLFMATWLPATSAIGKTIGVGDMAPDIALPDQNGNTLSLASLKGNIVLVYFWASWEPNTEFIAPNLAILSDKYNNAQFNGAKGFRVYTISLDSDPQEWRNAVRRYHMPGANHVSDFYSTYASVYGFSKLPTYYLLDERGVIVGMDMSMADIDRALAQRATFLSGAPTTSIVSQPVMMNDGGRQNTTGTYPSSSSVTTSYSNQRGQVGVKTYTPAQPTTYTTDNNGEWVPAKNTNTSTINQRGDANVISWSTQETLPYASTGDTKIIEKPVEMTTVTETPKTDIPATTASTKGSHYKIQLGAFKYLNSSDFDKAKPFGTLIAEQAGSDVQRVMLGDYANKNIAVQALAKVREAGYTDAFVMIYDSEKRIRPLTKEETAAIAKAQGIVLIAITETIAKPIEMSLLNTTTTTTASSTPATTVNKKVSDNKPLAVAKESHTKATAYATVATTSEKIAKTEKLPSVANTAMAKPTYVAEAYKVMPIPPTTVYTPSNPVQTNYDNRVVAGNSSITTYSYEPVSAPNRGHLPIGNTTPQTYSTTYTTAPNPNNLNYGTISEAYSTPRGNTTESYNSATTTKYGGAPTTYSSNSTTTTTTNTVQQSGNGVWVPIDIAVFNSTNTTQTSGNTTANKSSNQNQYDNVNFNWYPEAGNSTTRYTSPSSTAQTGNTNRTSTSNPTTATNFPRGTSTPTPTNDRARAAQNLADTYATPTNNNGTTTAKPANTAAATTPTSEQQQKNLDSYIDKYLNDYEYSASKSKRLKAKDKRSKKDKKK